MAKKKHTDSFFSSFWGALGNYTGVKVAGIIAAILSSGFFFKTCNDTTKLPPIHGGVTVTHK